MRDKIERGKISSASVLFEKHQPERRRDADGCPRCCCGSCCCCCCLHTLGGLIGATAATLRRRPPTEAPFTAVGFYWSCFAGLIGLAASIFAVAAVLRTGTLDVDRWGLETAIVIGLLFLPVAQLAASVITFVWIAARKMDFQDKASDRRILGRITIWSILGTAVGLLAMIFGCKMMMHK